MNRPSPARKKHIIDKYKKQGLQSATSSEEWKKMVEAKEHTFSSYFLTVLDFYRLKKAGYQFKPDELTLEEWFDLSDLVFALEKPH